jgi:hypothetical protein
MSMMLLDLERKDALQREGRGVRSTQATPFAAEEEERPPRPLMRA